MGTQHGFDFPSLPMALLTQQLMDNNHERVNWISLHLKETQSTVRWGEIKNGSNVKKQIKYRTVFHKMYFFSMFSLHFPFTREIRERQSW